MVRKVQSNELSKYYVKCYYFAVLRIVVRGKASPAFPLVLLQRAVCLECFGVSRCDARVF